MEIRVLRYFLAVAQEESISGAAEYLHLTQPTLSRQLMELEEELGKKLFHRGNRKVSLTEDGVLLRKRAGEIVDLVEKTESEFHESDTEEISGDIFIGAGETDAMRYVARAAHQLQQRYPSIHFHVSSGDSVDVLERVDKGLLDFGLVMGETDAARYGNIKIPVADQWGVLMRQDSPLSGREWICPEDLWDKPLLVSRQAIRQHSLPHWLKKEPSELNIAATYNLIFNASLMVDEGMGYALTLDKLINTTGNSSLCFRPLSPKLELEMSIIWKKYQVFSKATLKFMEQLSTIFQA